jgi:hypothetical protein
MGDLPGAAIASSETLAGRLGGHATGPSVPAPNRMRCTSPVNRLIAAACVDRAWTSMPTHVTVFMAGPPQLSWGQPEPLSGQTSPREERPATHPGRSTLQQATHAIWSEMDARVKGAVEIVVVVGVYGGGCAGVGRPARRQRQLVTLRCAGRDRMTVSGRELPRTRFASRNRIDLFEGSPGGSTPAAAPARVRGFTQRRPPACRAAGLGRARPR